MTFKRKILVVLISLIPAFSYWLAGHNVFTERSAEASESFSIGLVFMFISWALLRRKYEKTS